MSFLLSSFQKLTLPDESLLIYREKQVVAGVVVLEVGYVHEYDPSQDVADRFVPNPSDHAHQDLFVLAEVLHRL